MSKIDTTATFIHGWTSENVNADHFEPGDEIIDALAVRLVADASKEGITVEDLREVGGDPSDIISEAWGSGMSDAQERWLEKNP